jgi:hypothetical protein
MDQNHVCRSRTLKQAYCNTDLLATKSSQKPGRPHHQTLHTRRGPSNWISAMISFQKYAFTGKLTEAEVPDILFYLNIRGLMSSVIGKILEVLGIVYGFDLISHTRINGWNHSVGAHLATAPSNPTATRQAIAVSMPTLSTTTAQILQQIKLTAPPHSPHLGKQAFRRLKAVLLSSKNSA